MIQLSVPDMQNQLRPRITVFGVGGAGGNAVNNMIRANLEGVEFVVANSDAQALAGNLAERKLQLGVNITRGLGAGAKPEVGKAAAEEQIDEINAYLEGTNMAFITAGMGGGTGTGAAPVIARAAREQGILTVGVVTKPFHFEGGVRMRSAEAGIAELQQYVDTLIIIPNQNLFRIANEKTTFADAFRLADEVLHSGVRGVTDLMVMPGLINLDFADIRSVMGEMGKAMMGTGESSGERRSVNAAEAAIANPLLDDVSMKGARGVLINITGGYDMTLFEVDEAANRIREEVDPEANIIFGSTFDEKMDGKMRVSVVATGIDVAAEQPRAHTTRYASPPANVRVVDVKPRAEQGAAAAPPPPPVQQPQQQRPVAFNAGFAAPAAAQASAQQAAAARAQPTAAATAPSGIGEASPSFSSPFSWGQSKPVAPSSPTVALDQLLERAKRAESIMHEALAQTEAQPPLPAATPVAPAPQADYAQAGDRQTKRSGSLFSRLAEFGSRRAETPPEAQAPGGQPRLGIDPADRPRPTSEEDTLEIPAFLRRQSN
jgi:cell division protein FtsZ